MAFQKFPNSKQLLAELNSNKLSNIYLFLGEEDGEKEKVITKIIDLSIKDQNEKNYSSGRFHLESDELNNAAEFVISESMFSEKKVCIMLNVNSLKAKGGDKELLNEIITTLPDSNIIIMTSTENKVPAVLDNNSLKKIKTVQFWKFFDSDISTYVYNRIKKNNLDADRSAIIHLIDLTGRDIRKIDEAVETIIETGEKHITTGIIDKYISDTKEVSVFEFIDALFQKDKNAFFQLAKVIDSGTHELTVLKLIMRQAELIEKYLSLSKSGLSSDDALQETGISPKNTNNFIVCTQKFSLNSIKKIFPLIYNTDQRIKSSGYSDNLASNPIFELITDIFLASPVN
jgi:DNA polymerase III delta subunit